MLSLNLGPGSSPPYGHGNSMERTSATFVEDQNTNSTILTAAPPMAPLAHSNDIQVSGEDQGQQQDGDTNEHQQSYHVDTLVEMMGCTQERARAVLAAHDYSLERAVDVLLSEE